MLDWSVFRWVQTWNQPTPECKRTAALEFIRAGFSIVPCETFGKSPIKHNADGSAKFLRDLSWDDPWAKNDIDGDPHRNLGIVTGEDFWVLDIDGERGDLSLSWLRNLIPGLSDALFSTLMIKSGKGYHYYFRSSSNMWCRSPQLSYVPTSIGVLPGIDTRGRNGVIIVPPSIHANGAQYRVLNAPESGPIVAPDMLEDLLRNAPEMTLMLPDAIKKAMGESDVETASRHMSKAGSANKSPSAPPVPQYPTAASIAQLPVGVPAVNIGQPYLMSPTAGVFTGWNKI